MPQGSSDQTVNQNADPWGPVQIYLKGGTDPSTGEYRTGLYPTAHDTFEQGALPYYPDQSYLDPNAYQQQGMTGLANYADQMGYDQKYMFNALRGQLGGTNEAMGAYSPYLGQSAGTYGDIMNRGSYGDVWGQMGDTAATRALAGQMSPQGNPYLNQQIAQGQQQMMDMFNENVMQNIRDEAIMTGQYGGSNQGMAVDKASENLLQQMSDYDIGMRGSAYQADMNRALQAASTGAGFEFGAGQAGIQAQQAVDAARMGAAGALGSDYLSGLGIGTDAASRALALAPQSYAAGSMPFDMMQAVGSQQAGFDQTALNDAMNRYYYPQQADMDMMNWYSNLLYGSAPWGSSTTTQSGADYNNVTGALGGAAMGAGAFGAMSWNPWLGAGLGALSMIDW